MKKIRVGNDFVYDWEVSFGGIPVDLSGALYVKISAKVFRNRFEVASWEFLQPGMIRLYCRAEDFHLMGTYRLILEYAIPDAGLADGDRKITIDEEALTIVSNTADADHF